MHVLQIVVHAILPWNSTWSYQCPNTTTSLDATEYRDLVGCFWYLVYTWSNIAFIVGYISRFMEKPHYREPQCGEVDPMLNHKHYWLWLLLQVRWKEVEVAWVLCCGYGQWRWYIKRALVFYSSLAAALWLDNPRSKRLLCYRSAKRSIF